MKLKNFRDLIEKRFTKDEIAIIEQQAKLEVKALRSLQTSVKQVIDDYMKKNDVGFNEVVRRLNSNATQVSKIQRGQANLTLASLAHISALLGQEPVLTFKKK
jgi:transcriptional regulator with XRE-family HTH domain